jgi:hypothetical protein
MVGDVLARASALAAHDGVTRHVMVGFLILLFGSSRRSATRRRNSSPPPAPKPAKKPMTWWRGCGRAVSAQVKGKDMARPKPPPYPKPPRPPARAAATAAGPLKSSSWRRAWRWMRAISRSLRAHKVRKDPSAPRVKLANAVQQVHQVHRSGGTPRPAGRSWRTRSDRSCWRARPAGARKEPGR